MGGGRWKVVGNNDRERYLQGHSSETVGYLFSICSTLGHLFMSLFHCACLKLHFDVFSHTVVRIFRMMSKCESHLMYE